MLEIQKNRIAFFLVMAVLLTFSSIAQPLAALAAEQESTDQEVPYSLVEVTEKVVVGEALSLVPGTYVYVSYNQTGDSVHLQFKNETVELSSQSFKKVDESSLSIVPEFNEVPETSTTQDFQPADKLYGLPHEAEAAEFQQQVRMPVYQDDQGRKTVLIGHISFYINQDDYAAFAVSSETAPEQPESEDQASPETAPEQPEAEQEASVSEPAADESQTLEGNVQEGTAVEDGSQQQVEEETSLPAETEQPTEEPVTEQKVEMQTFTDESLPAPKPIDPWEGVSADYFKATEDNVPVYDNRGEGLKKVGELTKGQVYPRVSDYGNWHRIQFGNIYGYVKKSQTFPADGTSLKNENSNYSNQSISFVTQEDMKVYDNTSGSLVPFGTVEKGITYPIASEYGSWWRVIYSDRVGYVRKPAAAKTTSHQEEPAVFAEGDKYFRVNEVNVSVYDNRGGGLKKVGELTEGQVYSRVSDYGNWHRIQFGDFYGYVRKSSTEPASKGDINNLNNSYYDSVKQLVIYQPVTVYDNTSGSLVPFAQIEAGTEFPVVTDYGNWWRIVIADRVGYVRKADAEKPVADEYGFTEQDKFFEVTEANLPVYDNRNGGLKKVGELSQGQIYPRVRDYGNWHRIQYGDFYGYVMKSSTKPADGTALKNINKNYTNQARKVMPLKQVTVYDNTSGSLVPFGKIDAGVQISYASDYGNWWRVLISDRVGYIQKSEVSIVFAAEEKYFKVNETGVPVYSGESNTEKVGVLTKDQVYPRISDNNGRHKIQFGGSYGYVPVRMTQPASGSELKNVNQGFSNQSTIITVTNEATVYDNTSGSLVPFGKLAAGFELPYVSDYGNWYRILVADRVGYINKSDTTRDFVASDKFFRATGDNVPVYETESDVNSKVGELVKGQVYPRKGSSGGWHIIQFNGLQGYVPISQTEVATGETISNLNDSYQNSNDKIVATNSTTVYDNSKGSGLVAFGVIDKGTVYSVVSDYGDWWRVLFADRVGYVRKSDVELYGINKIQSSYTFEEALARQMNSAPQTDVYKYDAYVHSGAFSHVSSDGKSGTIESGWNIRSGIGTSNHILTQTTSSRTVSILGSGKDANGSTWYKINLANIQYWVNASKEHVSYYLNPLNFVNDPNQMNQFLDLSRYTNVPASKLNALIDNSRANGSIFEGTGEYFREAASTAGINEIYLFSHAMLETGYGWSTLAKGVRVDTVDGQPVEPRVVYNFFGVGAIDSAPIKGGSETAYKKGWFTPKAAILGGAQFAKSNYLYAGQSTLYDMRWNPLRPGYHQYATDIGWAYKQIGLYNSVYQSGDQSYQLQYNIPVYKEN